MGKGHTVALETFFQRGLFNITIRYDSASGHLDEERLPKSLSGVDKPAIE